MESMPRRSRGYDRMQITEILAKDLSDVLRKCPALQKQRRLPEEILFTETTIIYPRLVFLSDIL